MLTNHDLTRLARFVESGEASLKRLVAAGARPVSGNETASAGSPPRNDGRGATGSSFKQDAGGAPRATSDEQIAADALRKLGLSAREAWDYVRYVSEPGMSADEILTAALKARS